MSGQWAVRIRSSSALRCPSASPDARSATNYRKAADQPLRFPQVSKLLVANQDCAGCVPQSGYSCERTERTSPFQILIFGHCTLRDGRSFPATPSPPSVLKAPVSPAGAFSCPTTENYPESCLTAAPSSLIVRCYVQQLGRSYQQPSRTRRVSGND